MLPWLVNERVVVVGTSPTLLLSANQRRRALVISSDGNATVWLGFFTTPANKSGLALSPQNANVQFTEEIIGRALYSDVYALSSSVSTNVWILEVIEPIWPTPAGVIS